MNKAHLVDKIAADVNISKSVASRALDAFIEAITTELKEDKPVALVGFGTFSARIRAARIGRNPKTGEAVNIAETKAPVFKAGKTLKDACN